VERIASGGMHAVVVRSPGGPDQLSWQEIPDPVAGPGELVVDVAAAGVNRADLLQREGSYPPPPGASETLGLEVAGTVAELGAGVTGWARGDRVCALLSGGGYAERVAVPAGQVMAVPDGLDLVDAGGLMETSCTVWSNVYLLAHLQPGQTLLVHGGTSGIGTTAIGLARATGSPVFATAGTPAKVARCLDLGADLAVDYRRQDFVAAVRDATDGAGADVVLDVVGGSYLERNVEVLATEGRLVCIAVPGGRTGPLDLGTLLRKRAAVLATSLRSRPVGQKAAIVAAVAESVAPLISAGRFAPVIDRRVPMADAAQAHRALAAGETVGKVLLVP